MNKEEVLISAIIVTYNRADIVVSCIESLLEQTYSNLEIIVVDNKSTDNSVRLIQQYTKEHHAEEKVKVIECTENLMNAGGRNVGIRHARGELLLFVDSDNVLDKNLVRYMKEDFAEDEKLGIVGALTIQNDDRSLQRLSANISLYTSHMRAKMCNYKMRHLEKTPSGVAENVFMVRAGLFGEFGEFDRSYYIMYEETDFQIKVTRAGWGLITDPRARTLHYRAKTGEEIGELRALGIGFPLRAYYFARNRTVFMRRYAPFMGKVCYYTVFMHMFMVYYCLKAVKYKRFDIVRGYLKGYVRGVFSKI